MPEITLTSGEHITVQPRSFKRVNLIDGTFVYVNFNPNHDPKSGQFSGGASSAVSKTLTTEESKIRNRSLGEVMVAVDGDGKVTHKINGGNYEVSVPEATLKTFGPTTHITHNHPGGTGSFSFGDVRLAADRNVAEIRAVTPTHTYSLAPGKAGWPTWKEITRSQRVLDSEVTKELMDKIDKKQITEDQAVESLNHEMIKRFATKYKLKYTRTAV